MKRFNILLVFCMALTFFVVSFSAHKVLAIPGDANGDGIVSIGDAAYLYDYLFFGGQPPPNPIDADVDGTAGINQGDVFQLTGYLFWGLSLEPFTGVGPDISNIEFTLPRLEPGSPGPYSVPLKLTDNPGPDLMTIIINFSYQNLPGHVAVTLDSVSFTGSIMPAGWYSVVHIDNANMKACVMLSASSTLNPHLVAGTTGLIATLNFTRTATGDPTCMSPVFYPTTNMPLLLSELCADGTPPLARVLSPKIGKKGDANSDGNVTVSDVIFIVNYLFKGGPSLCGW